MQPTLCLEFGHVLAIFEPQIQIAKILKMANKTISRVLIALNNLAHSFEARMWNLLFMQLLWKKKRQTWS